MSADRERIDRRDELAEQIRMACIGEDAIRYDEDDWTRIADLVLPMIEKAWWRGFESGTSA